MADTAWRKSKDKVTAKRGKKRDAGDTTHKLLKGNELTVQRLSSEVSGKAKSRPEFVPFTEDELTIENIKRCCERHFAAQVGTSLVCDILAGEQSPSCKTLEQIADMKFSATIQIDLRAIYLVVFRSSIFCPVRYTVLHAVVYMQLFFLFGRYQYQFDEKGCILFSLDYSLCHSSRAKYHKLHNNHETMKQQLTLNYSPT
ncbi:uncharacterized protein LOC122964868 [Acropora millepora]|uniref:uncharacterized protein LOC122964868 n=1 Tax=Acropora millepora TaxID=45264 RepID=UPI001CF36CCA|nr:uncharacterized protein LOC122964868 [Acropora millepora]